MPMIEKKVMMMVIMMVMVIKKEMGKKIKVKMDKKVK